MPAKEGGLAVAFLVGRQNNNRIYVIMQTKLPKAID